MILGSSGPQSSPNAIAFAVRNPVIIRIFVFIFDCGFHVSPFRLGCGCVFIPSKRKNHLELQKNCGGVKKRGSDARRVYTPQIKLLTDFHAHHLSCVNESLRSRFALRKEGQVAG